MRFITAWSAAAFVLVPAIGLAQENGTENTKKEEPGIVNKVIEKVTGRSVQESDKNVDANKQDANKAAETTRAKAVETTPILTRSKRPSSRFARQQVTQVGPPFCGLTRLKMNDTIDASARPLSRSAIGKALRYQTCREAAVVSNTFSEMFRRRNNLHFRTTKGLLLSLPINQTRCSMSFN